MKTAFIWIGAAVLIFSCRHEVKENNRTQKDEKEKVEISENNLNNNASKILDQYLNDSNILVVAHRADWRNACENSIMAIENAIEMGVDMVEIDLKKTMDDELVLMHDHTLDRTTTGKGFVKDHTLEDIKKLYLKDGAGHKTRFKVPTLKEALLTAKDKILINLDQSFEYFEYVLPIIKETNTADQIIIKAYNKPLNEVKERLGFYIDSIQYMPIIKLGEYGYQELFNEVLQNSFEAVEFTFSSDTIPEVEKLNEFQSVGTRVWVNALWPDHNGGHHDDRALKEPDAAYGWLISKGINIIQTDRPKLLLEYLRSKNLHN
ncbi:glycerophosphodiester phosphodiesterase family protein [Aestuariivivens sediminis]|uniref:glycerophosphodiester phosphodiesterase family protein n=1 Tax=Aestuariivivens sediminis TaxID=2913557 RepID=UPI001F57E7AD|nr:glycerophosphodiester phosphodiesterase family protein [Aestuariivivens sediminis]